MSGKMKEQLEEEPLWVQKIRTRFSPGGGRPTLKLTLIIPVYNCSQRIAITLESIRRQNYPALELIIIDAGSTDRTLEIINSYASMISRVDSLTEYHLPEMMNRGISLASGDYITFLYPGSFYLSSEALLLMAEAAVKESSPEVLYSGSIQKEMKRPAILVQERLSLELLSRGKIPATIVATWFRKDLFARVGTFDSRYLERAAFDFFSRIAFDKNVTVTLVDRVLVDFDYGPFSYGKGLRIVGQSWSIISHYFGFWKALSWFLHLPNKLILKSLFQLLKK